MDPNIRMIDLSQLTQRQAQRVASTMRRDEADAIELSRIQKNAQLSALSFWLMVLGTVVWALWGIGRIAYWW